MTPHELAAWAERAGPDEQFVVLRTLFVLRHGEKPPRVHGGSAELTAWLRIYNPFLTMLDCGAFESAAISLVPEGWVLYGLEQTPEIVKEEHTGWEPLPDFSATLLRQDCAGYRNRRKFQEAFSRGFSAAFALALAAAIARTMED